MEKAWKLVMPKFKCTRSNNYRNKYFSKHKPVFRNLYFCSYCGRIRTRRYITIDHLYPISKAQKSATLRWKLRFRGYKSINDVRNLVPACRTCNEIKSDNVSIIWIIAGRIGSVQWLWIPRHIFRLIILYLLINKSVPIIKQIINYLIQ